MERLSISLGLTDITPSPAFLMEMAIQSQTSAILLWIKVIWDFLEALGEKTRKSKIWD